MQKSDSHFVIIAALAANSLIAIIKFIVAFITNSSAMMSEGFHSLVDIGNQSLLLLGLSRAKKKPDADHPFGYGKEIYFWSFIVAILLFALGGGFSIYEGITHWRSPSKITHIYLNYAVILFAFIFELSAWTIAMKAFKKTNTQRNWLKAIHKAKDPALMVVLLEDSAAILGLIIAFVGISLSYWMDMPHFDAIASVLIGVVLLIISIWLAYESKHLLIGEAADPIVINDIKKIVNAHPHISGVQNILTMHVGPNDVLVTLYVDFYDDISSQKVEQAIADLELSIKKLHPEVEWLYIAAKSFSQRQIIS